MANGTVLAALPSLEVVQPSLVELGDKPRLVLTRVPKAKVQQHVLISFGGGVDIFVQDDNRPRCSPDEHSTWTSIISNWCEARVVGGADEGR